jgi:hypothetical protein
LQHDSQVLWKEVSFGVCKTRMRQRAWQQRRGKGSIETIADETAWEALSGVGEAKGKSEHVRVKCPERACACLACLVTPTFPFSLPLIASPLLLPPYPAPNYPLSSLSFPPPSHFHPEGPRGVTTFAVFSLISNFPDRRALSG